MEPALTVLAAIGFAAALWRGVRALARVLRRGVDAFVAREVADARAQRGDLTGMAEAQAGVAAARRARRRALAALAVWAVLLIVPAFLPFTRTVYASYSILWLILRARERRG